MVCCSVCSKTILRHCPCSTAAYVTYVVVNTTLFSTRLISHTHSLPASSHWRTSYRNVTTSCLWNAWNRRKDRSSSRFPSSHWTSTRCPSSHWISGVCPSSPDIGKQLESFLLLIDDIAPRQKVFSHHTYILLYSTIQYSIAMHGN